MKKVLLIGQFSPPVHGLSKALDTIALSKKMNSTYDLRKINITNNKIIIKNLFEILKNKSDIYYFTISHSKLGNLRDLIILSLIICKRKTIIVHYHGGYFLDLYKSMNIVQRKINWIFLNKVNRIIVLGNSLKSLFTPIVKESKIKICENFVEDISLLKKYDFEKKVKNIADKKKFNILFLSNFIKSKGYIEILYAASLLNSQENIEFHFAGKFFNEQDRYEFFEKINDLKLTNVKYHGIVDGDEKKKLLNKSDIFILPSYYHIEGQPISIIEAMANGLAIITTKHAGIPDIVSINNGVFVNKNSIEDIVIAIKKLTNDRNELREIAIRNRRKVTNNLLEKHYIDRIISIFEESTLIEKK